MFDYCTSHLRLSEPAAVRRIRTARCLAQFPELRALLASGEVNLTTVSMVAKILKPGNKGALLARIRGKSKREVEAVIAEYEPRAMLPPDRVRTVVVPLVTASASTVAGDGKESSILESQGDVERGTGDSEKSPSATISSSEGPAAVQLERWALVHFRTREVVIKKLERVRSIASHRLPGNAPLDQVVEFLADRFLEREDPAERHARREERKNRRQRMPEARSEEGSPHIPKRVRDHVFARDKGQCTYVSPNGKRCGSTRVLQVDHIHPIARGGPNTPDNPRLLCAYHNRLEAERLMGRGGPFQRPSRGPGSFRL